MDKGVYCLGFRNPACTARVGALGEIRFRKGWHVYVGSALGPGGLARLQRHLRLAQSRDKRPKWHVDYLSVSPEFRLRFAVSAATDEPLECTIAQIIAFHGGEGIPGFGCSDCSCPSHLFYFRSDPLDVLQEVFVRAGDLAPATTLIRRDGEFST